MNPHAPPHRANRLVVAFSDIEMGAGGNLDDFPHSDWLAEVLLAYNAPPYDAFPVDIVFNGDTFDLLKTAYVGTWPRYITPTQAVTKLDRVEDVHGPFFEAVHALRTFPRLPRAVHFLVGNHDLELLFPEVQHHLERRCRCELSFPGLSLQIGQVHLEHGHQEDPLFRVDPETPFAQRLGRQILALPWGSVGILQVAMPMHSLMYDLDRLKPRGRVFELLPDVKELVVGRFWEYYTRRWWREVLNRDPVASQVSWSMVKELAYRLGTGDPVLYDTPRYREAVRDPGGPHLLIAGHLHRPGTWRDGDRKVIRTGCLRNEYPLAADGSVGAVLPKTWAEVWMEDDRVITSNLVEVEGPPAPQGHVLQHVSEFRTRLEGHLPGTKPSTPGPTRSGDEAAG